MGRHRVFRGIAALLLLMGLLPACGGGDDAKSRPSPPKGLAGDETPRDPDEKPEDEEKTDGKPSPAFLTSDASGALLGDKKPPSLVVTISPVEASHGLGEMTGVVIDVKNTGKTPMRCSDVVHDTLSAYVEIGFQDTKSEYIRIRKEYFATILENAKAPRYLKTITIQPGEKASTTIRFLVPEAGTYTVRGVFRGFGPSNLLFHRSDPATIEVLPDGEARFLRALMSTDLGELELAFYTRDALATVIHFLTLVSRRFYDNNVRFHRVQKNFVIQTGDPGDSGLGGPGFYIPQEFNRLPHLEGTLSMFRRTAHPDTAGSQFFICLSMDSENQKALDGHYTVFGFVAKDFETALKIGAVSVDSRMQPLEPIRINSVTVVKR